MPDGVTAHGNPRLLIDGEYISPERNRGRPSFDGYSVLSVFKKRILLNLLSWELLLWRINYGNKKID
jgi:hypothetical protein